MLVALCYCWSPDHSPEVVVGAGTAAAGVVGGVATAPTVAGAVAGAAVAAEGVAVALHGGNTALNGLNHLLNSQGSGQGRGKNNAKPDPDATGDHSVIKKNDKGETTGYTTYEKNDKNPSGFDEKKRVDVEGAPHFNKKTGQSVPTPHTQGKDIPGGVRPSTPEELPKKK